jgi:hypothetical protein
VNPQHRRCRRPISVPRDENIHQQRSSSPSKVLNVGKDSKFRFACLSRDLCRERKHEENQANEMKPIGTSVEWLSRIFALLTFLHAASIERLNGPDIVRIKLGERVDLSAEISTGIFSTYHVTSSVQGGAVIEPMYV